MGRFTTIEDTKRTLDGWVNNLIRNYYKLTLPQKVKKVRSKGKIKVLFLISEIGPWKTENLYDLMSKHDRFLPIIGVYKSVECDGALKEVIDYLNKKCIPFSLITEEDVIRLIAPDIIFYQKPYKQCYPEKLFYEYHLNSLFCYVCYSFNTMDHDWAVNLKLYDVAWQIFFENELSAQTRRLAMKNGGKNLVVTGLPIQDIMMTPKSKIVDPWRCRDNRKRIIYAPHHTIGDLHNEGIGFSSFLENGEYMLEMMQKYKDKVYWAFKPHPLLYPKLVKIWGEERANSYYKAWDMDCVSQFENGEYLGLFKYSDCMIHDCCSFTIEYHYTLNPVLYLDRDDLHSESINNFAQLAYNMHYKAKKHSDIDAFIQNVINGVDPMLEQRKRFYDECLQSPNGKSACENIIDSILGEGEFA